MSVVKKKALALAIEVSFLACAGFAMTERTSADFKRDAQNTFLCRAGRIFYPDGVPPVSSNEPVRMNQAQFRAIQADLRARYRHVEKLHERYYDQLAKIFGPGLPRQVVTTVRLVQGTQALAYSQEDGVITVDVQVVRALYRGAVTETFEIRRSAAERLQRVGPALREGRRVDPDDSVDYTTVEPQRMLPPTDLEREAVAALMNDLWSIDALPVYTHSGDVRDKYESATRLLNFIIDTNPFEAKYDGVVMFVLAHERAHIVLEHFRILREWARDHDQDSVDEVHMSLEHMADVYATLLLSTSFAEVGPINLWGYLDRRGYEPFFRYSYAYAGFSRSGPGYPTVESRLNFCRRLNDTIVETWKRYYLKKSQ